MEPKRNYATFVDSLCSQYPSLTVLAEFLGTSCSSSPFDTAVSTLNILKNGSAEEVLSNGVDDVLIHIKNHSSLSQNEAAGFLILLEDPSAAFVEPLGAALDINPLFFAGHIATFYEPIEKRPLPPVMTMFPSQVATQDFIHLHSQRVIDLGGPRETLNAPNKLIMPGNIPRKVRRAQSLSGRLIGILRVCTSIMCKQLNGDKWVCLVLLDSMSRSIVPGLNNKPAQVFNAITLPQVPRRIRVESFHEIPTYSAYQQSQIDLHPTPASLLIHLTNIFRAHSGYMNKPSIFTVAYYPMRLMMAEWMLYTVLMEGYVKFYEYTLDSVHQRQKNAENEDFAELHRWRRSSKQSLQKLHSVEAFVLHWQAKDPACEKAKLLLQDIRHIVKQIEQHRHSLETMVAIMTSVIQLTDSRRSIEEAFNIRRLTYIGLVFIPLSFTASIFSMGEDFGPGKDRFWIYFATAIPLVFIVLASSMIKPGVWNGLAFKRRNRAFGKYSFEKSKV